MKNKPLQNRKKNSKTRANFNIRFQRIFWFYYWLVGWFVWLKKKIGNTSGVKQSLFLSWTCTVQSYIKALYLCQWWAGAAWKEQWQRLLWIQQSAQPCWWEVVGSTPRTWSQTKQERFFKKFKTRNAERQSLLFSIKLLNHITAFIIPGNIFFQNSLWSFPSLFL